MVAVLIHLKSFMATADDMVTGEKKFFNFQQVNMTFCFSIPLEKNDQFNLAV